MKLLNLKSILAVGALVLFGAAHASAGTICPATTPALVPGITGCDVLFTINANNSVTVTTPSTVAYEQAEDQLIGVLNNSSTPLAALNITGALGSDLFGFEGDGVCAGYLLVPVTGCGLGSPSSDPTGYAPAGVTFSNPISTDSGTVNFSSAIAGNGGMGFFSLEGAPNAAAGIGGTVGGTTATPEPGSLMLLGSGLFGLVGLARRKVRV